MDTNEEEYDVVLQENRRKVMEDWGFDIEDPDLDDNEEFLDSEDEINREAEELTRIYFFNKSKLI